MIFTLFLTYLFSPTPGNKDFVVREILHDTSQDILMSAERFR